MADRKILENLLLELKTLVHDIDHIDEKRSNGITISEAEREVIVTKMNNIRHF
jgi:hypothetical protein